MTKAELISNVAGKTGVSKKDTEQVFKSIFEKITETVSKGDKFQVPGFGTFEVSKREARTGRNPLTGETINISAKNVPKFKAGKAFKDACN